MLAKALLLAAALTLAVSPDPSGSWLSYAEFDAKGKRITAIVRSDEAKPRMDLGLSPSAFLHKLPKTEYSLFE